MSEENWLRIAEKDRALSHKLEEKELKIAPWTTLLRNYFLPVLFWVTLLILIIFGRTVYGIILFWIWFGICLVRVTMFFAMRRLDKELAEEVVKQEREDAVTRGPRLEKLREEMGQVKTSLVLARRETHLEEDREELKEARGYQGGGTLPGAREWD